MEIYFATNNQNKFREIDRLIPSNYTLLNLKDLDFNEDIPETGHTLKANAEEKALFIRHRFGVNCFADDTGLEVKALNGMPGVYSARYAGENKSASDNIEKLLKELGAEENREASFKTVICLILNDQTYFFEGSVEGVITRERSGKKGFGYDPVFRPKGYDITFAEMDLDVKNKISHRALATKKLIDFLHNYK